MKKTTASDIYRHCVLRKGATEQIAWIPQEFAVQGKWLRIKDDDGWQVRVVGLRESGEFLVSHEREYLRHRDITDV